MRCLLVPNPTIADLNVNSGHTTAQYGAVVEQEYRQTDLLANPPSPAEVSVELLMASQTHLGHATALWHPANSQYIFGVRDGIHIISMDATLAHLRRAATIITQVTEQGGVILFAGTRPNHQRLVVECARRSGACHLFDRWIAGTITNGQQILERFGVKVIDEYDQDVPAFKKHLDGRPVLKPDLVVCFNVRDNYTMLHECGLAGIPTIGVVDTDANPSWVTYPIPANDDSIRSVALIAGALSRAGEQGIALRRSSALRNEANFERPSNLQPLDDGEDDEDDEDDDEDDEDDDEDDEDEDDEDEVDIDKIGEDDLREGRREADVDDDGDAQNEASRRALDTSRQPLSSLGQDLSSIPPSTPNDKATPSGSVPASTLDEETTRLLSDEEAEDPEEDYNDVLADLLSDEQDNKQDAPHSRRNVEKEDEGR